MVEWTAARRVIWLASFSLAVIPGVAGASTIGTLGNFDAVNDTGKDAHGFEVDLEGITSADVTDTFGGAGRGFPTSVERYGAPTIVDTATGVAVIYSAVYSGGQWSASTPAGVYTTPGESCWTGGGASYGPSTPCDHFGVGTSKNPTKTTNSWLTETSPGVLNQTVVNLPAPTWTVTPNPVPAAPPHVAAVIQAPEIAAGQLFGDAIWVKIFTTQYDHPVRLEDLVGGNAIVPEAASETEVEWQILQAGVVDDQMGEGNANNKDGSVLRRYEYYAYTGGYSAEGEILSDNAKTSGPNINVGMFLGAQNAAVNLAGNQAVPAPEPASAGLFAAALSGVLLLRRAGRRPG